MKYQGSKNRHAKDLLSVILHNRKPNQYYVEPFCGGCNMIDKVEGNRIANDSHKFLIDLFESVIYKNVNLPDSITDEEYNNIKNNKSNFPSYLVGFVDFGCSYSGKWFGGYARSIKGKVRNYCDESKRNILKQTDGIFWDEVQNSIKGTDIKLSEIYIDNMAQQMVVAPEQFNGAVLVSTNLFMDIISELASGLVGSIGLIYSANIGDNYAMFEAAHGSAPQLAGQNKVNPTATVLSGAWMADYMGEREVRDAIFSATEQVINEGKTVTWDIGGNATTTQMTDAIITYAKNNLRK